MNKVDQIRDTAISRYTNDNVVIDDDAAVEWADGGAWVTARIWVDTDDTPIDPACASDVTIYGAGST